MNSLKELKEISKDYTVLYVEDDKNIANTLINYLSKFFKQVMYAQNGEEGLKLYNQMNYDIVITDINMPKMDGLKMSQEIKKINNNQNIIIVSAYSEIENFLTSIKIGVDGYIIKPIDYQDINNLLFKTVSKIKAFKDNEELKKHEENLLAELSRDNNRLKQFTEVIDEIAAVSKIDLEGKITYVNPSYINLSEYTQEELIGKEHSFIGHPDMSKSIYQEIWEDMKKGKIWEGTLKNISKNNNTYFIHATFIPLLDINKEIIEYIKISFLTTKEEIEKREFKRKVMTNYLEFKKTNINAIERISDQYKELESLKNEHNQLLKKFDKIESKYKKASSQIDFYEKNVKEKDGQYHKIFNIQKSNLEKIGDSHKKSLMKIEKLNKIIYDLQEEHDLKAKQIVKLNGELNEQTNIILDLRDTIKNIKGL